MLSLSHPQPEPEPELLPSPPVESQTKATEAELSTGEKEPTNGQEESCAPIPEEQTSAEAKPSSDSKTEEKKHNYKMAFVKST